MRVMINVTGSALVYYKRNVWNIVLITEDCHTANFRNPLNGDQWEILARPEFDRIIEFSSTNATPPSGFSDTERAKFLNMYHEHLHGPANGSKGDIRVRPKMNDGRRYVLLKVPYGTIKQTGEMSHAISYKFYPIGREDTFQERFAKQFSIEFDVNDNNGLLMSFHDPFGQNPYKFPTNGNLLVLAFDNYCDGKPDYNDFIHYYDWVRDENTLFAGLRRKYVTKETEPFRVYPINPDGTPHPKGVIDPSLHLLGRAGDCDPVIIEPPPGD